MDLQSPGCVCLCMWLCACVTMCACVLSWCVTCQFQMHMSEHGHWWMKLNPVHCSSQTRRLNVVFQSRVVYIFLHANFENVSCDTHKRLHTHVMYWTSVKTLYLLFVFSILESKSNWTKKKVKIEFFVDLLWGTLCCNPLLYPLCVCGSIIWAVLAARGPCFL